MDTCNSKWKIFTCMVDLSKTRRLHLSRITMMAVCLAAVCDGRQVRKSTLYPIPIVTSQGTGKSSLPASVSQPHRAVLLLFTMPLGLDLREAPGDQATKVSVFMKDNHCV
jgi:hypothetical protein